MQVSKIAVTTQQNVIAKKNGNFSSVNFRKNESTKNPREASTGKKWGVGLASLLVTGLGQLINGDTTKGLAMFGGGVATLIIRNSAIKARNHTLASMSIWAGFGLCIYSIVDAVKNAKPSNN